MKEFLWGWLFIGSLVFCSLLVISLLIAYALYSTAPLNPHTPVFSIGFGLTFGFIGLAALTVIFFDKLSKKVYSKQEAESELFKKVVNESPFFFFSLLYFFMLTIYISIFLLLQSYIRHACM